MDRLTTARSIWTGRSLLDRGTRLELVDSAVRHQCQKQMTVPDDIRPNVAPLLHEVIVQRTGQALRTRQRQRAELDLVRAAGLPRTVSAIAVDARNQLSAGGEFDRVPCAVIGSQRRVITALELDQLPRRAYESQRGR